MPKLILPIGQVPNNSTVMKITGRVPFTVRRSIKIYGVAPNKADRDAGESRDYQEIKTTDCSFLVGENGNINAYSNETEVMWIMSDDELYDYAQELVEGPGQ